VSSKEAALIVDLLKPWDVQSKRAHSTSEGS
jgi:hypothetical protein